MGDPPRAASSPDAVLAAALRLVPPPPAPGARALDVPCGTGRLARALAAAGWDVEGRDRDPGPAVAAGVAARAGDMEAPLEGPDGSFHLVACVEGIEHIEGQAAFLRECARLLAPGGWLVLTTPNVLGRPSRVSLARHGYARFSRPTPEGSATPYEHEHVHPVDVLRLEHLLRGAGLAIEAWDGDRGPDGSPTWRARLARRLLAPRLARHNPRHATLLLPAVYHARVVALRARKPTGPPPPRAPGAPLPEGSREGG